MASKDDPRRAETGEGVRFVSRQLRRQGPGCWDFLDLFSDKPWSLLAVRAPIQEVTETYAETRGAVRRAEDMVDQDMRVAAEWSHVVQLRGDVWTIVYRDLRQWFWGDRYRTGVTGMDLSTFLSTRTVVATYDAASYNDDAKYTFEVYEDGRCVEEIRWLKDGELLFHRCADGGKGASEAVSREAVSQETVSQEDLHRFFQQQGVFLPPAKLDVDGVQVRLELHGVDRSDVERVDFLVFEEIE